MVQEGQFRRGIKVMAHAQGVEGIKNAVLAGIHSIEHGFYLDDEVIGLMIERGTFLVPTLVAPLGVLESAEQGNSAPEYALRKAREALEAHRESIARAYRAGVKIAMGTDAAVMPHGTNLRELGLMCDCGMSPMESLVATPRSPRNASAGRIGSVPSKRASSPMSSSRAPIRWPTSARWKQTSNIALVMKGGAIVKDIRAA